MTASVISNAVPATVPGNDAYDYDGDDTPDDSSSVDTNDALLEMLGLASPPSNSPTPPMTSVLVMDEDDLANPEQQGLVLVATPMVLPPKCSRYGPTVDCAAVVVDDFMTSAECQALVTLAQARGFGYVTHASHVAPDQSRYQVQLQTPNPHKLAVLQDARTLDTLWNRLRRLLLSQGESTWLRSWQQRHGPVRGLNPRLRVLQYDALDDDRFEPHFDATTRVDDRISRITVLVYLNQGGGSHFEGGETRFLNHHISNNNSNHNKAAIRPGSPETVITPQTGRLVMFEHDLYHAGAPLTWGTKHVLRTDILFDDNNNDTKQQDTDTSSRDVTKDNQDMVAAATTRPTSRVVAQVCQSLGWTEQEQAVLDEMGVLSSTLEAFLLPGTGLLTQLLLEGGVSRSQIDRLLQVVQEQVQP